MRVGVGKLGIPKQHAQVIQQFDHVLVTIKDDASCKLGYIICKAPLGVYWGISLKTIFCPNDKVVLSKARRCMNATCTSIHGYVIPNDQQGIPIQKWVLASRVFQGFAKERSDGLRVAQFRPANSVKKRLL
ncbi:MAG: hypothetical protein BWX66_01409 [Deltaproteobacteria bacterium ADurb.Bin058]|nr:MAG: hypothetical protein BWX66_01409 [Deltaproteobacteria bacterium ADurb.Bin058]